MDCGCNQNMQVDQRSHSSIDSKQDQIDSSGLPKNFRGT